MAKWNLSLEMEKKINSIGEEGKKVIYTSNFLPLIMNNHDL